MPKWCKWQSHFLLKPFKAAVFSLFFFFLLFPSSLCFAAVSVATLRWNCPTRRYQLSLTVAHDRYPKRLDSCLQLAHWFILFYYLMIPIFVRTCRHMQRTMWILTAVLLDAAYFMLNCTFVSPCSVYSNLWRILIQQFKAYSSPPLLASAQTVTYCLLISTAIIASTKKGPELELSWHQLLPVRTVKLTEGKSSGGAWSLFCNTKPEIIFLSLPLVWLLKPTQASVFSLSSLPCLYNNLC